MSLFGIMFRFRGRISRRTFWLKGVLPLYVGWILWIGFVIYYIEDCFRIFGDNDCELLPSELVAALGIFAFAWIFVSPWIILAVCCKRFHDLGKSGWWSLLFFILTPIPLLIFVPLLILGVLEGQPSANEYGPPPTDEAPAS